MLGWDSYMWLDTLSEGKTNTSSSVSKNAEDIERTMAAELFSPFGKTVFFHKPLVCATSTAPGTF
ncbi:unnamed protein product [Laminaria digitata]